jgi:hypothetical protein
LGWFWRLDGVSGMDFVQISELFIFSRWRCSGSFPVSLKTLVAVSGTVHPCRHGKRVPMTFKMEKAHAWIDAGPAAVAVHAD